METYFLSQDLITNYVFSDNSFDVVTSILSAWESPEVYRVLKPGGVFILEASGARDKADFKYLFGKDEKGWSGQRLDY